MKLYNTMSRQVKEVTPREGEGNRLTMYTCGLTVYSEPQIGNWVAYIYSDVLTRVLLANDFDIRRIQNITDVGHLVSDDDDGEDKMEKGAKRENMTAWDVAAKYSELSQQQAYDQLGLLRPAELVPATSCIDKQIEFASALEEKGYLYRTPDGMYFDTSKVSDYGKLARLDIAGLEPGARVDMAGKRNITDFAVWKFSPEGAKRDMEWDSPWGVGFPGWHLECSTIILENLGEQIDIHTGGIDHIPVHHTNEIAQSEALTDKQFVRHWFHNNHMKVDGTKLSKSLGNSYTLDDITARGYSLDAYKLLVLSSHYRTEGNFTWEILTAAQNRLNNWRNIAALRHQIHANDATSGVFSFLAANQALLEALSDDLDTPHALAIIDDTFDTVKHHPANLIDRYSLVSFLEQINALLGIDLLSNTPDISDAIKHRIIQRERVREEKDWQQSDSMRDEIQTQASIILNDTPTGTFWEYK